MYTFGRMIILAYARLMFRIDIQRHEPLPPGPKIFVPNHPSATDPFLIHLISRQAISVLISGSAFTVPLFGRFLRASDQIPVNPGQSEQTIAMSRRVLENGGSVAIFPEGLISPREGGFHRPRTGAVRLALSTGAPLVPVGIYLPRERRLRIVSGISGKETEGEWYFRGPYGVTAGSPLYLEGDENDRQLIQRLSDQLMVTIRRLAEETELRVRKLHLAALPA